MCYSYPGSSNSTPGAVERAHELRSKCHALPVWFGYSCVNVQCLGELRVLVWRRAGGRLTLSRADLWE